MCQNFANSVLRNIFWHLIGWFRVIFFQQIPFYLCFDQSIPWFLHSPISCMLCTKRSHKLSCSAFSCSKNVQYAAFQSLISASSLLSSSLSSSSSSSLSSSWSISHFQSDRLLSFCFGKCNQGRHFHQYLWYCQRSGTTVFSISSNIIWFRYRFISMDIAKVGLFDHVMYF